MTEQKKDLELGLLSQDDNKIEVTSAPVPDPVTWN